VGPGDLEKILRLLPPSAGRNVLVGLTAPDDAGVFRLSDEVALVQTVDFFTPVVDDPYRFGQIAAANALSDIYAMGGRPLTAMNIVCFPCASGLDLLAEILSGGQAKVTEAGAELLGGHTIEDAEPKFGLAVTGIVHPERICISTGARPGDALLLSKPLGTGVLATALKGGIIEESDMEDAIHSMCALNAAAAEVALQAGATAVTDVTGFGFLGHLAEMLADRTLSCRVDVSRVPLFSRAREAAEMGLVPAGTARNREFLGERVRLDGVDPITADLLFDAQTSGGLLFAVPAERAEAAAAALAEAGTPAAAMVGEFVERGECDIWVTE
jgi:selenide,water dikinase